MSFVVEIIPENTQDRPLYYAGRMVRFGKRKAPIQTDDISLAKKYKYQKSAERAVLKILLTKSSLATRCKIVDINKELPKEINYTKERF